MPIPGKPGGSAKHCNNTTTHGDDIGRPRDAPPLHSASARGPHTPPGTRPTRTAAAHRPKPGVSPSNPLIAASPPAIPRAAADEDQNLAVFRPSDVKSRQDTTGHNEHEPAAHSRLATHPPQGRPPATKSRASRDLVAGPHDHTASPTARPSPSRSISIIPSTASRLMRP
jgi:hypothetical protein